MTKNFKTLLLHFFYRFIDWVFRLKTIPDRLMRAGAALIGVSFGGWFVFGVELSGIRNIQHLSLSLNDAPELLTYITFFLGCVSFVFGLCLSIRDHYIDTVKRKVIVIEQRGLRASAGSPLVSSLKKYKGRKDPISMDIRNKDGEVENPKMALSEVVQINRDVQQRMANIDPNDVSIVYGGLMPVPFTFLTGMLLDDEGHIDVYDWDRYQKTWRSLNGDDDGDRFQIAGLNDISSDVGEVVLALSVSYSVDLKAIGRCFETIPMIHMELPNVNPSCHWSLVKQQELGKEFFELLVKLKGLGISRVHLIIAAPNSMVFNLGRHYDPRNLPSARIYQYEQSHQVPYPWSVELPTHGRQASIQVTSI